MKARRLLVLLAFAGLAVTGIAGAEGTQLDGTVGPGMSIKLTDAAGATVTHLDPGAFTLAVDDRSEEHNFHLTGPGVDVGTEIDFVGQKSLPVTLADGKYNFFCDVHPGTMKGSFTVGTAAPPPPVVTPTRLTLTATSKAVTLKTPAGKVVKTLKAGPVVITVRDRSATRGARLSAPGLTRASGVRFVGTLVWKGRLSAGTLVYRSDARKPVLPGGKVTIS